MLKINYYVGEMPSKQVMELAIDEMKAQVAEMTGNAEVEFVRVAAESVDSKTIILGDMPKAAKIVKINFGTVDPDAVKEEDEEFSFTWFKGKIGGEKLNSGITGDFVASQLGVSPDEPAWRLIGTVIEKAIGAGTWSYLTEFTITQNGVIMKVSNGDDEDNELVYNGRAARHLLRMARDYEGKMTTVEKKEEYDPNDEKEETRPAEEEEKKNTTDMFLFDGSPNPDYVETKEKQETEKESSPNLDDLFGSLDSGLDGLDELFAAMDSVLDGLGDLFGGETKPVEEEKKSKQEEEEIDYEGFAF